MSLERTGITRRDLLCTMGGGFGAAALAGVAAAAQSPLTPRAPHFEAKAKQVIYLFLNGGPSQVDTFDPKPELTRFHGKAAPSGNLKTERKTGTLLKSPFAFRRFGQSGLEISEIFSHLGAHADDLCIIRSMHTERPNHEPSLTMLNCGHVLVGHPSMGAWLTYGLGTENQNLPGFVVLCPGYPVIGPQLWSSAFLPGIFQGTYVRGTSDDPEQLIRDVRNRSLSASEQQRQMALLNRLNRIHAKRAGADPKLEASIESFEMAYRMQSEAMDAFDVRKEDERTRERYGPGDFARGCLLARRLVERGVRMVQVYYGDDQPWDNHENILQHADLAATADRPMGALLQDLKDRDLLKSTIVIIGGEFGRTPSVEVSGLVGTQNGRDHNNHGFSLVVAGGGFRGGMAYGATDEFGFRAVEKPVHPHDLHATVLHQLGLDHTKLTYRYSGRDFRLTDVAGSLVRDIIS
jgi:hypothetical protein